MATPPEPLSGRRGRRCNTWGMKRWMLAWLGAPVLGIANGAAREAIYADAVGEEAAHIISTGTLLALLAGYISVLQQRWPLGRRRDALSVGAVWAAMTVVFEFGFGHWAQGDSWSELLENYKVAEGRVWVLVPLSMLMGPEIARELAVRCVDRAGGSMPAAREV